MRSDCLKTHFHERFVRFDKTTEKKLRPIDIGIIERIKIGRGSDTKPEFLTRSCRDKPAGVAFNYPLQTRKT